jgi:YidC/Oxa1 family membrane protein insertase
MNDQKNTILAIALSLLVLLGWEYFIGAPRQQQLQQQQQQQQLEQQASHPANPTSPASNPVGPSQAPVPGQASAQAPVPAMSREAAVAAAPRVAIATPSLKGSISLKGGQIDDLSLIKYHETVDPHSPPIEFLSPLGSPDPFFAEFGWIDGSKTVVGPDTMWRQQGTGALDADHPVTLVYNDPATGLEFHRIITVDTNYMFRVTDEVINKGSASATLYPYARISRYGTPPTLGYSVLHEGLIGVLGNDGLQEVTYKTIESKKSMPFQASNAWLGITDKYWAATLIPDKTAAVDAEFVFSDNNGVKVYQADYHSGGQAIAPGGTASTETRLFAGAKVVSLIDAYQQSQDINRFDRLIDWGWFYFLTKPMFSFIDMIYQHVGNFGIAILIVTVVIKALFFPLANKSYASMAKMKEAQPQMKLIRERYADDKVKQQQELMELYKREKINPIAGCLPIAIQIPVFFSLYKVLIVTIEMRHAPFFGWIHDLSVADPTNVFTLFGLLPYDPSVIPVIGSFMHIGVWPLVMGVTMWMQMKLNPPPPDPAQKMMFDWMPVIFTFMMANFSAGLVIYWAWNNSLSVMQQSIIMRRNGAKVELWDNIAGTFANAKNWPQQIISFGRWASGALPKLPGQLLTFGRRLWDARSNLKPPKL